jgi:hypothetical protein
MVIKDFWIVVKVEHGAEVADIIESHGGTITSRDYGTNGSEEGLEELKGACVRLCGNIGLLNGKALIEYLDTEFTGTVYVES